MLKKSSDFEYLAAAASIIRKDVEQSQIQWKDSPFEWVLRLPAGSKGKLGKHLISQYFALKGLSVTNKSIDPGSDMLVNGHRMEIKFSTLWNSGIYKFQQIRDQDYEFMICLGISPFEAHCWVINKQILKQEVIGHLGQHTGKGGTETFWFSVNPSEPQQWLINCGGTLESAFYIIRNLRNKKIY